MTFYSAMRSRLLIACSLGVLLILSLGTAIRVVGQGSREGLPNLDVILLIDNSAGMSQALGGDPASDPDELRIRAARFLVDFLKANAEATGANHRVGVASFGGVVSDTIPLRLLSDSAVRDRIHGEVIDYTDFRPPLQYALGELRSKSFDSGNKMAVVLFTDGQPWPAGASEPTVTDTQKYFSPADPDPNHLAGLVRDLQNQSVQVFVLGIGNAQKDRTNWTQPGLLPTERFITITSATDLADVYHRLAGELLGLPPETGARLTPGQTISIPIEPYQEQLIVSFMRSDLTSIITLTSPSGVPAIAAIDSGSHHLVYRIPNPAFDGPWTASWTGKGEVQYWVDRYYPLVKVFLDVPFPYTGQPYTVTAGLLRNGVVITDADLRLEAEIIAPNAVTLTRSLDPLNNGYHAKAITDALQRDGTYAVTAKALLNDQELSARRLPATIIVLPLPAAPTVTPRPTDTPHPTDTPQPTATSTSSPSRTLIPTPLSTSEATPFPPRNLWNSHPQVVGQVVFIVLAIIGVAGVVTQFRLKKQKKEFGAIHTRLTQERDSVNEQASSLQQQIEDLKKEVGDLANENKKLQELQKLMDEAREAVRTAGSDSDKLRDADAKYQIVLERAEDIRKSVTHPYLDLFETAWKERLEMWSADINQQRQVLYEGARTATEWSLRTLAEAMKERWVAQPDCLLIELYGTIESGGQAMLEYLK